MRRLQNERRNFLKVVGMSAGALVFSGLRLPESFAKDIYPSERITWICYVKAGGGFDLVARSISPYLGKYLKESTKDARGGEVVVKNVPEAGGRRAFSNVFHAKPDGYTIGDFNSAFVTEEIGAKVDFDYHKFTFLSRTTASSRVILVHKDGFKSWEEMMKAGKERELKWAASNFGRGHHISCILVKEAAKVPARLINFPGAAENINALLRKDVHMAISSEEAAKPMIDAGELRILVVLSESSPYPGVSSIAQLGFPELADPLKLHRFVVGPPGLPKEVVDALITGFKKVFSDKEFLALAKKLDFDPEPVYGAEAERQAKMLFKYYDDKMPILKKYLS